VQDKIQYSDESRKISAEKISKKMKGYEFIVIPENVQNEIINLYQSYGPKLIASKITETGYPIKQLHSYTIFEKIGDI
jgi:ribosomal protein L9